MKRIILIILFTTLLMHVSVRAQRDSIAPDFKVVDVHGTTHFLYDYLDAGKFVLIDFFTTGCVSCQFYAPLVNQSFRDFGCNEGEAIFMAINYGAHDDEVLQFDSTYGIEFPSVSGIEGQGNMVNELYDITYYPRILVISPEKRIVINEIMPATTEIINDTLQSLGLEFAECVSFEVPELNQNEKTANLSVSPNPADDIVQIEYNLKEAACFSIEIYNTLGKRILQTNEQMLKEGLHQQTINLATINNGMYFMQVIVNKKIQESQKLIIH